MTELVPKPNRQCPLCGGDNACAPASRGSFDVPCWCHDIQVNPSALAAIPGNQRGQACLCPRCAAVVDG